MGPLIEVDIHGYVDKRNLVSKSACARQIVLPTPIDGPHHGYLGWIQPIEMKNVADYVHLETPVIEPSRSVTS